MLWKNVVFGPVLKLIIDITVVIHLAIDSMSRSNAGHRMWMLDPGKVIPWLYSLFIIN